MQLDIYWTTLLVLLPAVVLLTGRNIIVRPFVRIHTGWRKVDLEEKPDLASESETKNPGRQDYNDDEDHNKNEQGRFRVAFLSVYLLVMSSEWLSGPYLYTHFRDDEALSESVVIALYATAYTSAAISATVTGFLADRYGRRRAGIAQCGIHSLACLTVIFGRDCLPVLFVGRVFAGTALTMLWTVFESWMVTEWNARGLERDGDEKGLSRMFGLMTTANCMAAMVGGVLGHCLVSVMGSKLWPFWAGIVLECVAVAMMLRNWNENYGVRPQQTEDLEEPVDSLSSSSGNLGGKILHDTSAGITDAVNTDGRIWALTFVACCFEGTTFLIMYFWPSVLQDAHVAALTRSDLSNSDEVPYGVIFATFMAAMILGTIVFSASSRRDVPPAWLLMAGVMVANGGLLFLSILGGELPLFGAFLLFEVANGMYVPSMAYLRGLIVDEKSRTGMYGLMKIPLFVFVILALSITAEGNRFKRLVFASASMCLLLAAAALVLGFGRKASCPEEPIYSKTEHLDVSEEELRGDTKESHELEAPDNVVQLQGKGRMMLEDTWGIL